MQRTVPVDAPDGQPWSSSDLFPLKHPCTNLVPNPPFLTQWRMRIGSLRRPSSSQPCAEWALCEQRNPLGRADEGRSTPPPPTGRASQSCPLRRKCRCGRPQAKTCPSRPGGAGGGKAERRSERRVAPGRRPARRCRIDGLGVAAKVLENPINRGLLLEARNHTQPPAAAPADLHVDGEHCSSAACVP